MVEATQEPNIQTSESRSTPSRPTEKVQTTDSNLNVDPQEVQKFNAMAEQWWDPTGSFKPLHDINPLRTQFIEQSLTESGSGSLAGKKVLDIGCGGGILTEGMHYRGADVTGIDMGEMPLNIAQQHAEQAGLSIQYERITAEAKAAQAPAQYDVVTCLEMLEHVPDPASVIAACSRLCKPGGQLFFSTINRNPKAYLFAVIGAEYVLKLLPKGTHNYDKFIKPSELSRWIRQANLTCGTSIGLHYNPITQHYSLGRDVSVNYMLQAFKPE